MNWIKRKLRQWLRLEHVQIELNNLRQRAAILEKHYENLVSIGVDVHFKEPHMILIYSQLNGGQLRHIGADFKNLRELDEFVKELKARYRTDCETWDLPQGGMRLSDIRGWEDE